MYWRKYGSRVRLPVLREISVPNVALDAQPVIALLPAKNVSINATKK
jgi:hypothetical protein